MVVPPGKVKRAKPHPEIRRVKPKTQADIVPQFLKKLRKKYNRQYCEKYIELASQGLQEEEIGYQLKLDPRLFAQWANNYKEFAEAREIGRKYREAYYHAAYRKGMFGDIKINAPLMIFKAKNVLGMRDRIENIVSGGDSPLKIIELPRNGTESEEND